MTYDLTFTPSIHLQLQAVDEAEGLDKIEELQNHSHEDIYDKAVLILETFFDVEDGEAENLAPQVRNPSQHLPRSSQAYP